MLRALAVSARANMADAVVRFVGHGAPPGVAHAGDLGAHLEASAGERRRQGGNGSSHAV